MVFDIAPSLVGLPKPRPVPQLIRQALRPRGTAHLEPILVDVHQIAQKIEKAVFRVALCLEFGVEALASTAVIIH
jgi:hypothetical protein